MVKQLKDMNLVEREFKEKIEAIDVMDHSYLVSLMAYYSKDEKLLVDNYMPMGNLFALLYAHPSSPSYECFTFFCWNPRHIDDELNSHTYQMRR